MAGELPVYFDVPLYDDFFGVVCLYVHKKSLACVE